MKLRVYLEPEEQEPALLAARRAGHGSIGAWCLAMIRAALAKAQKRGGKP